LVKGYVVLQKCESGDFTREIVNNHFMYMKNVHFRNITDEWEKSTAKTLLELTHAVSAGGASAGGAVVGNGGVLKRERIPTIGRHAGALVGSAAAGGAAAGGAAGGIFPGASFLPGKLTVYPPRDGITYNGINFKEGDTVTVKAVTGAEYDRVLNTTDPTVNKGKLQLVYSMGGDNFVMVHMLDFAREARVVSANRNFIPIAIGARYVQDITHMKVNVKDIEAVAPAAAQVGATAAPAVPGAAAVGLANAMQSAVAGLFAPAKAKAKATAMVVVNHVCATANCGRVTWNAKPGYCCKVCQNGTPNKHSHDCGVMQQCMEQLLESSVKKQKQEGGSGGGGGGA
jgi:hypothetical protein